MPVKKSFRLAAPLLALCLSALGAGRAPAQGDIRIELDATQPRALLELFGRGKVTDEELLRVSKLHATQALIRQASRFDPAATEENFRASLRRVVETGASEPDPFRLAVVRSRLEASRSLLQQIEEGRQAFLSDVVARMREYAPAGVALDTKVHFVLGGTSDGFAPASEAFYIALHYFGDDAEGLKTLMAHELFHNVQAGLRGGRKPEGRPNVTKSLSLLQHTVAEGTASMVGDPLALPAGKPYTDFLRAKYKRNLDRIATNFALFEALLFRAYHDPGADYDQLYRLGFSGTWDSPLYFVGYRMGRVIEKYEGKAAVRELIGAEPARFFARYVEVYRKHNDPDIVRFSKPCEEILQSLQRARP